LEPTPHCGEQDRGDIDSWTQPDGFPDPLVRRGSMLTVGLLNRLH
jgi:hypothetical protein